MHHFSVRQNRGRKGSVADDLLSSGPNFIDAFDSSFTSSVDGDITFDAEAAFAMMRGWTEG